MLAVAVGDVLSQPSSLFLPSPIPPPPCPRTTTTTTTTTTIIKTTTTIHRSCTAFYYDGTSGLDLTDNLVIYPINIDSWVCNHLWDSQFIKVPYCGGSLSAQVRALALVLCNCLVFLPALRLRSPILAS
jgi:hypothetical protein